MEDQPIAVGPMPGEELPKAEPPVAAPDAYPDSPGANAEVTQGLSMGASCSECSHAWTPGARFCNRCGATPLQEQQELVALVPKPPTSPHPQSPAPRKKPAVAGPAAAGLVPGGSDKSDGAKNDDGGAFKSEGAKSDDGSAAKSDGSKKDDGSAATAISSNASERVHGEATAQDREGAADLSEPPPLWPQGDRDVGSILEDVPLLFEAGAQVLEESPLFVGEELQEPAIDDLKNRALDRMLAGIDSGALDRAFEDALRPLDGPGCKHEKEVAELKKQLEQMRAENESLRLENKQLKKGSGGVGADSRSPVAAGSAINAIRAAQGGGVAVHAA